MSSENNTCTKSAESPSNNIYQCSCSADRLEKTNNYEPRKDSSILQCRSFQNMLSSIKITKHQTMMLIYNYMIEQGYIDIATHISETTGISTNNQTYTKLINLLVSKDMESIFAQMKNIIPYESEEVQTKIKKIILIHFYHEFITEGNYVEALKFVRKYAHKASIYPEEAYELTTPLMTEHSQILLDEDDTDFRYKSLRSLVNKINMIAPTTCEPQANRLETLMKYALMYQYDKCILHSHLNVPSANFTLYEDHICSWSNLPCSITQSFDITSGAIWNIEYSHTGDYIAISTFSKQLHVFTNDIYTKKFYEYKRFEFDTVPSKLRWSPDDSMILVVTTCGRYVIFVCQLKNEGPFEVQIQTSPANENVTSIDWFSDNVRYAVGTLDGNLYVMNITGHMLCHISGFKIHSLLVLPNNETILFSDDLKRIISWNIVNMKTQCLHESINVVNGLLLSPDKQNVLVSIFEHGLYLFSLRYNTIVRFFNGVDNKIQASSCSFMSGTNSNIFVTPTQHGFIRYFHINKTEFVHQIKSPGSSKVVAISWHPLNPKIMVSGSEDGWVSTWESETLY